MEIKYNPMSKPLSNVIFNINQGNIIIKPSFQREIVWKEKKMRDELMKSIFLGFPIGVFTAYEDEGGKSNIVDGLQRIDTIRSFYEEDADQYNAISANVSRKIIASKLNIIRNSAHNSDKNSQRILNLWNAGRGFRLRMSNLPLPLKQALDTYSMNFNYIYYANAQEIRDYFIVVQNQEKLKAGEIIKSIESNDFVELISNFQNLDEQFKEINFNNSRHDFMKYCVAFTGLFNERIKFGVPDKIIIKYGQAMQISDKLMKKFKNLLSSISEANFTINEYDRQFNRYAMKLLIGYGITYSEKINVQSIVDVVQKLYYVASELSKLNSINKDRQTKIKADERETLKILSRLSKTTHSLEEVKNGLAKLDLLLEKKDARALRRKYIKQFQRAPSTNLKVKQNKLKQAYFKNYLNNGLSKRVIMSFQDYIKKS